MERIIEKFKASMQQLMNNEEMMRAIVQAQIDEWTSINSPVGHQLGYPKCCIDAFCAQPPLLMQLMGPTEEDDARYKASHMDGKYTGFIPCIEHAKQVLSGEVQLSDLIDNRSSDFEAFPNF